MIEKPTDGNWFAWVNKNYPFDPRWEAHLIKRTEQPRPGSDEQLDDLRGIVDRGMAASLAQLWFHSIEHAKDIEAAIRVDRIREQEKDKRRLIRIVKLALDGKLGESRDERDGAQSTAQTYTRNAPEHCEYWELRDWEKMHEYARRLTRGEQAQRPTLTADRRKAAEDKRTMDEMHDSIGAASAARPRMQQESLGQQW